MLDRDLIMALRLIKVEAGGLLCFGCGLEHSCCVRGCTITRKAADRLEALAEENAKLICEKSRLEQEIGRLEAQNEHFREVTKMLPKWISAKERLPNFNQPYIVTACDENAPAGEGIWYSTVVVVAEYYNGCWTWAENGTEYDLTGIVTHWMPMPKAANAEKEKCII